MAMCPTFGLFILKHLVNFTMDCHEIFHVISMYLHGFHTMSSKLFRFVALIKMSQLDGLQYYLVQTFLTPSG